MSLVRQLLLLMLLTLIGFAIFVLLFWAKIGSSLTILFYRGVALAIAAALLTGLIALWPARRTGERLLPISALAVSLSFNICFLVLFPVTVDRSVTVYLLSRVERQQQSGVDAAELRQAFVDDYVVKMGAVERRLDEQQRSGNVTVAPDGKVRLTSQGERFMAFSRLVERLFGTDPRYVSGGTEPARNREAH